MSFTKQQLMQRFITNNYLSLQDIAARCGVSTETVLSLENTQCIPGHTYEVRHMQLVTCAGIDSPLSENIALETTLYYHPSVIDWIKDAVEKLKTMDLQLASTKIKVLFQSQLEIHLGGILTPGCQSFDQAWAYWIDGTWGKCLKVISSEVLAKKELARKDIANFMLLSPLVITDNQKIMLSHSVNNYIDASLDFDPFGMRHMVVTEPIAKYELDIQFSHQYLTSVN